MVFYIEIFYNHVLISILPYAKVTAVRLSVRLTFSQDSRLIRFLNTALAQFTTLYKLRKSTSALVFRPSLDLRFPSAA